MKSDKITKNYRISKLFKSGQLKPNKEIDKLS